MEGIFEGDEEHCEKGKCLLYVAFGSRSCFDVATEILLSGSKETNQPA
jgi:hypothetical protein